MKSRNGFVTNSSSSNFVLAYKIELKNGDLIEYQETGCDGQGDPLVGELYVNNSPRELGISKNIKEMIKKLQKSVHAEDWGDPLVYLFDENDEVIKKIVNNEKPNLDEDYTDDYEMEWEEREKRAHLRALQFVEKVKQIKSMDEIKKITISGDEYNYDEYFRTYVYDLETGKYTKIIFGDPMEVDGSSGGDLFFIDDCKAEYDLPEGEE